MSGFVITVIFSNQYWGPEWLKYAICLVTKVVENEPDFYGNISHAIRFTLLIGWVDVINCCLKYYHKRWPWKSAEICDSISCMTFSKSLPSLGLTFSMRWWYIQQSIVMLIGDGDTIKKYNSQAILLIQFNLTIWTNRGGIVWMRKSWITKSVWRMTVFLL